MGEMSQIQCMVWDFRANGDMFTEEELRKHLGSIAKQWVFQLEKGETTGYIHWQGRMTLFKVRRKSELMSLMAKIGMAVPNYLEPTTTVEAGRRSFSYVMKADTRIDGPFTDKDQAAYIPRQYRDITLYPCQKQIIDSKDVFDFRVVDCIVDPEGCNGKSTLAAIADLKYGCIDLPWINDADKLIASLCDILIAKQQRDPGIIFVDMPRACQKEKLGQLYSAIEQIKKGKVWDMRNNYKYWWFDSPRVWVFTNAWPVLSCLTMDRWRFWGIEQDTKTLYRIYPDPGLEGASLEKHL